VITLYFFVMKLLRLWVPLLRRLPHPKLQYFFRFQGRIHQAVPVQNPIWIHASSGEIEYARSVIRALQAEQPNIPILVTHTSLSSRRALENLGVTATGVSPLDEPQSIEDFLQTFRPRACLIARTDLWPLTLRALRAHQIPTYLFSATFSGGTKKTSFWARQLLKSSLPELQKIYFVSEKDQEMCRQHFPGARGEVLGDTRYDQVFFRLAQPAPVSLPTHNRILIAGSTWPQDENVLLEATPELKSLGWRWIWAPHEVDVVHLTGLESALKMKGLQCARLGQLGNEFRWDNLDVLIIDRVGILAHLYPYARLAFIGGSFKSQVHSVMEALAASVPVLVGPHHHNSREALEFRSLGFVKEVRSAAQIVDAITTFDLGLDHLRPLLAAQMQTKLGATERLMQALTSEGLFSENSASELHTS